VAAILILVSGAVHLVLWSGEYKEVKIVGALFLLNVAAVVIAVALVVRRWGSSPSAGWSCRPSP